MIKKISSYEVDGAKFNSHEEAKKFIIDKEIFQILRDSLIDRDAILLSEMDIAIKIISSKFDDIKTKVEAKRKELFPRKTKCKK